MAHAGEAIADKIKQTITEQSTITAAINALKLDIPFLDDETCYRIIIGSLKQNDIAGLNLIDDYNTQRASESDGDINRETEDMLATFAHSEMKEYAQTMQSNDNIDTMNWNKIIECVGHEMWPKLGSIMKAILRLDTNDVGEVKKEDIDKVIAALKKKGIAAESINYLEKLIQRAMCFYANQNQYQNDESESDTDFEALLNDIWSVYKCYHFTQSNLTQHSLDQFKEEIAERARRFEDAEIAERLPKSTTNIKIKHDQCHLYPQYLIDDDIFDVFQYHF
eukprot:229783_1